MFSHLQLRMYRDVSNIVLYIIHALYMHSTCQLGIAQQRDCVAGFRLLMLQDQTQIKLHDEVMLNRPKV